MPFPTQKRVEFPILRALESLGGQAKPQEVYARIAEQFPQPTKEELPVKKGAITILLLDGRAIANHMISS